MSLAREALWHLGARSLSALGSSAVFALLARVNSATDAKAVFFFMFASGFVAAFLRNFCMFTAGLRGDQRRTTKLRRVRSLARRYALLTPLFAFACAALLATQAVEPWLIAAATCAIVSAGFDCDLLRAALGRAARFSTSFAIGSTVALVLLLLNGGRGVPLGALAVMCPWFLVAILNLPLWFRLTRRRHLASVATQLHHADHWPAALLTALYDGAVLNLPFFFGAGLSASSGFDLSVSMRLFASAQPFFPLVMHWANSGRLTRLSHRFTLRESVLFGALLLASGLLASVIFVGMFKLIGRQGVAIGQYMMFVTLLFGYGPFAAVARYAASSLNSTLRAQQVAVLLAVFVALWFAGSARLTQSAATVVAFQTAGLVALAASTLAIARLKLRSTPQGGR